MSGPAGTPIVRRLHTAEVGFVAGLAAAEGWDPGLDECLCYHHTDPDGFFVAELDGRLVGCISAVTYGRDFGFIGLFMVAQGHRDRGYGGRLWEAAMRRMQGRLTGLDAVVEEQARYERQGFRPAYANVRYSRMLAGAEGEEGGPAEMRGSAGRENGLVFLGKPSWEEALQAYDRTCFPAARRVFLQGWTALPGARVVGLHEDGRLRGYGMVRPFSAGYKVAPLFADDGRIARALYRALVGSIPAGAAVHIDIPQGNPAGAAFAGSLGMEEVFSTIRMYRGGSPAIDPGRVFGVTSLELG